MPDPQGADEVPVVTTPGANDRRMWGLLLLLLLVFAYQVYSDTLPPLPEPDPYDGWALAEVQEGDKITQEMLDELATLMARR